MRKSLAILVLLALMTPVPAAQAGDFLWLYIFFIRDNEEQRAAKEAERKAERQAEQAKLDEWNSLLRLQKKPGGTGASDTVGIFEFKEDEQIFFMRTQSERNSLAKGVRIECREQEPKVTFYMGSPRERQYKTEPHLWTAKGVHHRNYWLEGDSLHSSWRYYSPILSGEDARLASLDLLQNHATFGDDAGAKLYIDGDYDFDRPRNQLSCLQEPETS